MKIQKRTSVGGEWAKLGKDFEEGDILTIASEGDIVSGEYGERHVFKMKLKDGDKNLSFNQTTLNYLVDAYGDDSTQWNGKEVKVWVVDQNVQGKIRGVVYLTAPEWKKVRVNGELKFVNPNASVEKTSDEPNPDDIPF